MTENHIPILYSFRRCPYAMRARMAVFASGQQVVLREIVLRNKPQEMLEASPKATVPVLVKSNEPVLEESLDIMLWALQRHDPENWLAPENTELGHMLDLIEEIDGDFKHHLDSYKYSNRHVASDQDVQHFVDHHRTAAINILAVLNTRLQSQLYLFGNRQSLADVAIAPFVRQFANTDIDWFKGQDLPHLQAWLTRFLESDLFANVMEKHKPWQTGDAVLHFPPQLEETGSS